MSLLFSPPPPRGPTVLISIGHRSTEKRFSAATCFFVVVSFHHLNRRVCHACAQTCIYTCIWTVYAHVRGHSMVADLGNCCGPGSSLTMARCCTSTHMSTHTCLYTCVYTCVYTCLYACLYACLHTCLHICIPMCPAHMSIPMAGQAWLGASDSRPRTQQTTTATSTRTRAHTRCARAVARTHR